MADTRIRVGNTSEVTITLSTVPPGTDPKMAELKKAFDEGVAASRANDYDTAIARFEAALAASPACHECYFNIGYAYMQKQDEKQAEASWKKALEIKADHAESLNSLATLYNNQKRFDEAAAISAKAAAAAPAGNADAVYNQGIILWNAGKISRGQGQVRGGDRRRPEQRRRALPARHGAAQRGQGARSRGLVRAVYEDGAERAVRRAGQGHADPVEAAGVSDQGATIAARLDAVRGRMAAAAARAGRPAEAVRLVAVSKTYPAAAVAAAVAAGQLDFGENKVQEGLQKIGDATDNRIRWHVIGHLQSNKARKAAEAFHWIHAVDSVSLLRKLDDGAVAAGRRPKALVQVDLAGEATKFGAAPAAVAEIFAAAAECAAVELVGLMTLPPAVADPNDARPWFRKLVAVRDALAESGVPLARLVELSMGMSHDFEVAIEEGATIVRIGSAIFGSRG